MAPDFEWADPLGGWIGAAYEGHIGVPCPMAIEPVPNAIGDEFSLEISSFEAG